MADITKLGPDCDDKGDRGNRGKRGHRGPTGPTGPAGSTGSAGPAGGLLKFSGSATVSPDGAVESFLADVGDGAALSVAPDYPLAVVRLFRNLAVNLTVNGIGPTTPGSTVVVELLQNGVAVPGFAITYDTGAGEGGIKTLTAGPITYEIGDTFDLQVTTAGFGGEGFGVVVAATVGCEGA